MVRCLASRIPAAPSDARSKQVTATRCGQRPVREDFQLRLCPTASLLTTGQGPEAPPLTGHQWMADLERPEVAGFSTATQTGSRRRPGPSATYKSTLASSGLLGPAAGPAAAPCAVFYGQGGSHKIQVESCPRGASDLANLALAPTRKEA